MSQITYVDLNEVEAGQENWLAVIAREREEQKREEHKRRLIAEAKDRFKKRERKSKVIAALKFNENHDELGRFSSGSSQQSGSGSESSGASNQGGSGNGGGVSGAASGVESSGAATAVSTAPLRGSPATAEIRGVGTVKVEPNIKARQAAADYCKKAGIEYNPPTEYVKVDKERAKRIADAYEAMKNDPEDPEVKAAYAKMAEETIAQYQAVLDTGLKVEFIDYAKQGDPYAVSPRLAIEDVKNNNHFWVFPTEGGFGSDATFDASKNPLLAPTDYKISGKTACVNDLFRVVHDYFGHCKEGNGMRADGEENAWRSHSAMFTPLARRAMTSETRGQNSWVNFGPHAEANKTASGGETHYADQKVGLLPEWVTSEGAKAFEFIQFTKTVETKIARAAVKAAYQRQHERVERQAAKAFAAYFQKSVASIVAKLPSFKPDPENAKEQAASLIKRAFRASKQNDLLIASASQPVADAFLEGAYAEMRLSAAAKRRKKSLKFNVNHDESGRFASGGGSHRASPGVETIEFDDGFTLHALRNPSLEDAKAKLANSKNGELRGLIEGKTGNVWLWDAEKANHDQVAEKLGLDWIGDIIQNNGRLNIKNEGQLDIIYERLSKSLKYNENHDEAGRFASGSSSGNDEELASKYLKITRNDDGTESTLVSRGLGIPENSTPGAIYRKTLNLLGLPGEPAIGMYAYGNNGPVKVMAEDEGYKATRYVMIDDKEIENNSLEVFKQHGGTGTKILSDEVREASKAGFKKITTYAAKGQYTNGYYTWARLGFDCPINRSGEFTDKVKSYATEHSLKNVSDFMKSAEHRAWWKENGEAFHGSFDLTEGSPARERLAQYVAAKQATAGSGKSTGDDSGGRCDPGQNLGLAKYNENHDSQGRFAAGDGTGEGSSKPAKVTETPEFKAWFRDSKVVDASGNPKVVYHGTKTAGFNEFHVPEDHGRLYFTENPEYASGYTSDDFHPARETEAEGVYPVYLRIENPIDIDAFGRNDPKYDDIGFTAESWKEHGYDGAFSNEGGKTWMVFDAAQIKSATGNEGTFDPNNPDIRKSWGVKITTATQAARRAEHEIEFATTAPDWLTEAAQDFIIETFQEDYWLRIPETTRDDIELTLYNAIADGKSIRDIAQEIQDAHGDEYSKYRALNVARTEMTGSMNAGATASIENAFEGTGITPTKVWLSVLGPTTRDTHAEADGQEVLLDAEFTVGGYQCNFPGDVSLPPEERCNCQCSLISGEVESQMSDDDEEKSVKFNENHDHLGRFASAPDSGDGSGAQGTSPSEAKPESKPEEKPKEQPKNVEEIIKRAEKIEFTEGSSSGIERDDHEAIRDAMSYREKEQMEDALREQASEWASEVVDPDEYELTENEKENLLNDIDYERAADRAGYSQSGIEEAVKEIVGDNPKLLEAVDSWSPRRGMTGVDLIDDLIQHLDESHPDENLPKEINLKLEDYKSIAEDEIQSEADRQYEQLVTDAEESKRQEVLSQYEESFDYSEARDNYLENFYDDHEDRFQVSEDSLGKWAMKRNGEAQFSFKTSDDRQFNINAYKQNKLGVEVAEIQFSDESGNFSKTGAGKAIEVFGQVLPAVVGLIRHTDPPVITFSASFEDKNGNSPYASDYDKRSGESRPRLYDNLVSRILGVDEDRFAVKFDAGSFREYVVGKKSERETLLATVASRMGNYSEKPPELQEIKPRRSIDEETGVTFLPVGMEEIHPSTDCSIFTQEFWDAWERENGPFPGFANPGQAKPVKTFDPNQPRDDSGKWTSEGGSSTVGTDHAAAESTRETHAIAREPHTPPPPGAAYKPDVEADPNHDGVTDAARVGVPAESLPPPPDIPRLPNLTEHERSVESEFISEFEKDPHGMSERFRSMAIAMAKPGEPPTFGTDDAKLLTEAWSGKDLTQEERAENRATLNCALHQTANAIAKRAFVSHLDTLQPGDKVLVTVGGCGAGKGYALKKVPEALAMKSEAKAVWDSAGDQNATENVWIQKEVEARGLVANYVYVHADPYTQWADPERGVVKRAGDPADGRMVDAHVFADSYAIGAKNHDAFYRANKDNPHAQFVFLKNGNPVEKLDGVPKEALKIDRDDLLRFAEKAVAENADIPARVKRGALIGNRIWGEVGNAPSSG